MDQKKIFGSQVSAIGHQVRVVRYGLSGSGAGTGLNLHLVPEHLNPGPDGRDLGPENELATAMS